LGENGKKRNKKGKNCQRIVRQTTRLTKVETASTSVATKARILENPMAGYHLKFGNHFLTKLKMWC
jgi:hypothetical protein